MGVDTKDTLFVLRLSNNMLSGTLPKTLINCLLINIFSFEQNMLSGNIEGIFNATEMNLLSSVDLSNNQMTGQCCCDVVLFACTVYAILLSFNGLFKFDITEKYLSLF